MLTIFQVYSPEVLTAAVEILSMLEELPLLFSCMIMIHNPSFPFTAVPLWAHEMDGVGYPDALHTRLKLSAAVTLRSVGGIRMRGTTASGRGG